MEFLELCVIKSNYSSAYNLNYFETQIKSAETFVPRKSANFRLEFPWVLATSVSWFTNLPGPTSSPFGVESRLKKTVSGCHKFMDTFFLYEKPLVTICTFLVTPCTFLVTTCTFLVTTCTFLVTTCTPRRNSPLSGFHLFTYSYRTIFLLISKWLPIVFAFFYTYPYIK